MIKDIVIIGSGNVATHLGLAMHEIGLGISQVFSRNQDNAQALANKLNSVGISKISDINEKADLYVVAVKDDVISKVVMQLKEVNGIVVHTAGSVSVKLLNKYSNHGVLYPFQTFSKTQSVNFSDIPLLIEASDLIVSKKLEELAHLISSKVQLCTSAQRQQLHIAAVFACNFTNYMYTIASDLLKESSLSFDILQPLIQETANKVMNISPNKSQTGPAIRGDQEIINKHLTLLSDKPKLCEIYDLLSKCIQLRG